MKTRTKKMTTVAMLCAIAYVVMVFGRIPVVLFLKYDPKDVVITIGGFIFGPFVAMVISLIVSLIEMFTVSETGIIGLIMNVLSTCSFACTAAYFYRRKHKLSGAILGLVLGGVLMTVIMLLWNYLITPFYMGYPREAVAILLPVFLPFNLLKSALNAAITFLLYKPVVTALRRTGLVEVSGQPGGAGITRNQKIGTVLIAVLVLVTCVLAVLVWKGIF